MLKTRRQRSFWARIKLSMIISRPEGHDLHKQFNPAFFYLLNWFQTSLRTKLAGFSFDIYIYYINATVLIYCFICQLFPSLNCQRASPQWLSLAAWEWIYTLSEKVSTSHLIFFNIFFIFFNLSPLSTLSGFVSVRHGAWYHCLIVLCDTEPGIIVSFYLRKGENINLYLGIYMVKYLLHLY